MTGSLEDFVFAERRGHFGDFVAGAGVDAVENGRTQRAIVFVEGQHGRGDGAGGDAGDAIRVDIGFGDQGARDSTEVAPPDFIGVLLRPAGLRDVEAVGNGVLGDDGAGEVNQHTL